MKYALCLLLLCGTIFGQSASFINYKFVIQHADEMVKGLNNFQLPGDKANIFIGDTNHAITATYGSGLSFSVYRRRNVIFISDGNGTTYLNGFYTFVTNSMAVGGEFTLTSGSLHFGAGSGGIVFPDGTIQTTAYKP